MHRSQLRIILRIKEVAEDNFGAKRSEALYPLLSDRAKRGKVRSATELPELFSLPVT